MKEIFTYIGIIALSLFSFYYTEKVVNIFKGNDPIMLEIMKAEENYNVPCYEGSVSKEGVILGVKGKKVNKIESYNNMKAIGYDDSLLVFEEVKCNITKENNINKYILKGNPTKNAISIIVMISKGNIDEYVKLGLEKDVKFSYLVDDKGFKKYKDKLFNINSEILYSGYSSKRLKEYIKMMKKNKMSTYCISLDKDNLDLCSKENINVIKTSNYFSDNVYINSKKIIKSGEIIIIDDDLKNVEELRVLINYLNNKGFKILTISEHLL